MTSFPCQLAPSAPCAHLHRPRKLHQSHTNKLRTPAAAAPTEPLSFDVDFDLEAGDMKDLYKDFDSLLDETRVEFSPGDVLVAEVHSADTKGAYVDFGGKQIGWCSSQEASMCPDLKAKDVFKVGNSQEFHVLSTGGRRKGFDTGVTLLSAKVLQAKVAWKRVFQLMEHDIDVEGQITGHNRGGFVMDVMGLSAFCPFSQSLTGATDPDESIGKTFAVKILDCDEVNEKFVVSSRRAGAALAMGIDYKVGSVIEGTVSSLTTFGAFIDIGGGTVGLLHISQITHGHIDDLHSVLSVGDRIKTMVLSYDRLRQRASLSTKKLEASPGDMLKDPGLVFETADEMAKKFRAQVALAEKRAEEEELKLTEASKLNF